MRGIELRSGGGNVVTVVACVTRARHRPDAGGWRRSRHHADTIVEHIGYVQVAGNVQGDPIRVVELGTARRNAIAVVSGISRACDRGDHTAGDLSYPVIEEIGDRS